MFDYKRDGHKPLINLSQAFTNICIDVYNNPPPKNRQLKSNLSNPRKKKCRLKQYLFHWFQPVPRWLKLQPSIERLLQGGLLGSDAGGYMILDGLSNLPSGKLT